LGALEGEKEFFGNPPFINSTHFTLANGQLGVVYPRLFSGLTQEIGE
jgi:hypothetical protein